MVATEIELTERHLSLTLDLDISLMGSDPPCPLLAPVINSPKNQLMGRVTAHKASNAHPRPGDAIPVPAKKGKAKQVVRSGAKWKKCADGSLDSGDTLEGGSVGCPQAAMDYPAWVTNLVVDLQVRSIVKDELSSLVIRVDKLAVLLEARVGSLATTTRGSEDVSCQVDLGAASPRVRSDPLPAQKLIPTTDPNKANYGAINRSRAHPNLLTQQDCMHRQGPRCRRGK